MPSSSHGRAPRPPLLPPPKKDSTRRSLFILYDKAPSSLKGSVRVAVAVTAILVVGLATYPLSPDLDEANTLLRGFEWAAVTASLVPYNTVGEGGFVALAQVAATTVGGFAAFGFVLLVSKVALAFIVGGFVLVTHMVSVWLRLDITLARITSATFIIVPIAVTRGTDELFAALTRIIGISTGCLVALAASVLVLPNSATDKTMARLHTAVVSLQQLSHLSWEGVPEQKLRQQQRRLWQVKAGAGGAPAGKGGGGGGAACGDDAAPLDNPGKGCGGCGGGFMRRAARLLSRVRSRVRAATQRPGGRLIPEADPEAWHDASSAMHAALMEVRRLAPATQTELYLFSLWGLRYYVPSLVRVTWGPFLYLQRYCLPEHSVYQMRKHCQHAVRVLWVIFHMFENRFEAEMRKKWGSQFPEDVFAALRTSTAATLGAIADCFPRGAALDRGDRFVPDGPIKSLAAAVEQLGRREQPGDDAAAAASHARRYVAMHHARPLLHVTRSSASRLSANRMAPVALRGGQRDALAAIGDGTRSTPASVGCNNSSADGGPGASGFGTAFGGGGGTEGRAAGGSWARGLQPCRSAPQFGAGGTTGILGPSSEAASGNEASGGEVGAQAGGAAGGGRSAQGVGRGGPAAAEPAAAAETRVPMAETRVPVAEEEQEEQEVVQEARLDMAGDLEAGTAGAGGGGSGSPLHAAVRGKGSIPTTATAPTATTTPGPPSPLPAAGAMPAAVRGEASIPTTAIASPGLDASCTGGSTAPPSASGSATTTSAAATWGGSAPHPHGPEHTAASSVAAGEGSGDEERASSAGGGTGGRPGAAGESSGEEERAFQQLAHHRMYTFQSLLEQLLDALVGIHMAANELIAGWPGSQVRGREPPRLHLEI